MDEVTFRQLDILVPQKELRWAISGAI
jgi:hypothetical protein